MARRVILLLVVFAASLSAQTNVRRTTNLAALSGHPAFYHLRQISVIGQVKLEDSGELRVTTDGISMHVISKGPAPDGLDEIRGEFWDLGRLGADNPKLAGYDLKSTFKIDPEGAWPRPGQVLAIVASAVTAAEP